MKGFYSQIIEYLRAAGWAYKGPAKGSHEKWTKDGKIQLVPTHSLSRHTANEVLKQAGIGKKF